MKQTKLLLASKLVLLLLLFVQCHKENNMAYEERVVVANRAGSGISIIDARSNQVVNTILIPGSEPMYVVYVPSKDKIYVGDRAGKKIHIVSPASLLVEGSIPVGNGVFHMWADQKGRQLWVVNDVDNTISVIDLNTHSVIHNINVGMKPHDVFLSFDASKAYVSVISADAGSPDKIFMYSTTSFAKMKEVSVGKDPHLFNLPGNNRLYVPCQSGQLYTLNGNDLSLISNNPFQGAHGIYATPDQETILMTNISGNQLYAIKSKNSTLNGTATPSLQPTPHNIVVNAAGSKMFVTHSGASADKVSFYSLDRGTITPGGSISVGTNPFGIAYYMRKKDVYYQGNK